eukprot:gb/GECG01014815.1/.p1 GENE.gb/GECG01014815.1/~~gb/GECG01014815.1/.p1  ORF type:complete len:112 (+),score=8.30 gb/GECG01014815.1/:1-336(+)
MIKQSQRLHQFELRIDRIVRNNNLRDGCIKMWSKEVSKNLHVVVPYARKVQEVAFCLQEHLCRVPSLQPPRNHHYLTSTNRSRNDVLIRLASWKHRSESSDSTTSGPPSSS